MPIEDAVAQTVTKLQNKDLTLRELAVLLRYITRQIAKVGRDVHKKAFSNAELKNNLIIIAKEAERFLPSLTLQELAEFTNLMNVYHMFNIDFATSYAFRNGVRTKAAQFFTDEKRS